MTATDKHLPFLTEGNQYLKTAQGGVKRPAIFNTEILYNILSMAIEKHIMAALIYKGQLADNHTFTDLIDATRQIGGIDASIAEKLREFEGYQNICPVFAGYHRTEMPHDAILEMIATAEDVQTWMNNVIAA